MSDEPQSRGVNIVEWGVLGAAAVAGTVYTGLEKGLTSAVWAAIFFVLVMFSWAMPVSARGRWLEWGALVLLIVIVFTFVKLGII